MVLFQRLDDVNVFFAHKDVDLVACVDQHDNEKQDAAEGTRFGRQGISTLVN